MDIPAERPSAGKIEELYDSVLDALLLPPAAANKLRETETLDKKWQTIVLNASLLQKPGAAAGAARASGAGEGGEGKEEGEGGGGGGLGSLLPARLSFKLGGGGGSGVDGADGGVGVCGGGGGEWALLKTLQKASTISLDDVLQLKTRLATANRDSMVLFVVSGGIDVMIQHMGRELNNTPLSDFNVALLRELLLCFRNIMNNDLGLNDVVRTPEALLHITLCLGDFSVKNLSLLAMEILSVTAFFSEEGHDMVVDSIVYLAKSRMEPVMASMIQGLTRGDMEVKAAILTFVNALLAGAPNLRVRTTIRNLLTARGMIDVCDTVEEVLDMSEDDSADAHAIAAIRTRHHRSRSNIDAMHSALVAKSEVGNINRNAYRAHLTKSVQNSLDVGAGATRGRLSSIVYAEDGRTPVQPALGVMGGHLYRIKAHLFFRTTSHHRFYRLEDGILSYYEDATCESRLGFIDVQDIVELRQYSSVAPATMGGGGGADGFGQAKKRLYYFEVVRRDKTTSLAATSEEAKQQWLTALNVVRDTMALRNSLYVLPQDVPDHIELIRHVEMFRKQYEVYQAVVEEIKRICLSEEVEGLDLSDPQSLATYMVNETFVTGMSEQFLALLNEMILMPTEGSIAFEIWDLLLATCRELRTGERATIGRRREEMVDLESLNNLLASRATEPEGNAFKVTSRVAMQIAKKDTEIERLQLQVEIANARMLELEAARLESAAAGSTATGGVGAAAAAGQGAPAVAVGKAAPPAPPGPPPKPVVATTAAVATGGAPANAAAAKEGPGDAAAASGAAKGTPVGGSGAAAPPPPPLPGAKGPGMPPPLPGKKLVGGGGMAIKDVLPPGVKEKPKLAVGTKMKGLHWSQVRPGDMENTVWMRVPDMDRQLDRSVLENIFAAKEAKALGEGGGAGRAGRRGSGPGAEAKEELVSLIDSKRVQNVSIAMGRMRMTHDELKFGLIALDDDVLSADNTEKLLQLVPTPEEIQVINGYQGPVAHLGQVEKLFKTLSEIPRLRQRIECVQITQNFESSSSELLARLRVLSAAITEVRQADSFRHVLGLVLSIGNYLNGGTKRGQAYGFKLESLLKLSTVRAKEAKQGNLMNHIVREVERVMPEHLDFPDQWPHVPAAAEISLQQLIQDANVLQAQVRRVETEASTGIEGMEPAMARPLSARMSVFLTTARSTGDQVGRSMDDVKTKLSTLVTEYAEKTTPSDDLSIKFFGTLARFSAAFITARKQNQAAVEEEAKRRRIAAEQERRREMLRKRRNRKRSGGGSSGTGDMPQTRARSTRVDLFNTFKASQEAGTDQILAQFRMRLAVQRQAVAPVDEEDEEGGDLVDWES